MVFRFLFVIALMFTQKILSYIKALSVKLQDHYVDIVHAYREVENVKSMATLSKLKNEVLVLCQSIDIEESTPRIINRQQHR